MLVILSVLTGVVYPLLVTGIAQVAFPRRGQRQPDRSGWQDDGIRRSSASRSTIRSTSGAGRRRPRRSRTTAMASSGSNQGPRNPALADAVKDRIKALRDADPGNTAPVPVDLVTASGSGLDPHISVAAAEYQVPRVAKARGTAPRTRCARWSTRTPRAARSGSWASRGSTCWR